MKRPVLLSLCAAALPAAMALTGCSHPTYYAPPPPPPPAYAPSPALFDIAGRNGFQAGLDDGARDAYYGHPPTPRLP